MAHVAEDLANNDHSSSAAFISSTNSTYSQQEDVLELKHYEINPPRTKSSGWKGLSNSLNAWQNLANKYWLYEAISCVISLLALSMLFMIISIFNGRPRPKWPDYVSMNTLIAIITAILKASLMLPIAEGISELKWQYFREPHNLEAICKFDAASRGPWGSFIFLFHTRKHSLATFGAFVTICALAVDPFSQQVIKYVDCREPSSSSQAFVPRTNMYTKSGYSLSNMQVALDTGMTLSIYNGVLSIPTNASSLIQMSCETGNCTFPAAQGASYSSVAICHRTEDISHLVQNGTAYGLPSYSLPSGLMVQSKWGQYLLRTDVTSNVSYDGTNLLFAFESIAVQRYDPMPIAFRGSLWPCVKTWGGNVTHGILYETEVSSFPLDVVDTNGDIQISTQTLRNGTWSSCNPSLQKVSDTDVMAINPNNPQYKLYPNGLTFSNIPNDTVMWYPSECLWIWNIYTQWAMRDFLTTLFQQNNLTAVGGGRGGLIGDLWLQNIFQSFDSNMSTNEAFVSNLAAHMKATIRSNGDQNYTWNKTLVATSINYATGTLLEEQTCIHVRWPWLALPASMVLCSILFLIATISSTRETRRTSYRHDQLAGTEPLKSSPLPLLFHGIEPSVLEALGHPRSLSHMQGIAENLDVRIGRSLDDGNWFFVHAKSV